MLRSLRGVLWMCLAAGAVAAKPVVIWVNSNSDLEYYRNMVKVYKQKVDPQFEAEILSYGFMDMPNKLAMAIKTGVNPPDIVQLDELHFSIYLGQKDVPFVELSSRVEKAGLHGAILPNRMGLFQYRGKTYGVPQSTSAVVLYYRSDLFQQLGITPTSINTWDKFLAEGKRIKKDMQSLVALDWSYFEILLKQRGFDFFKPDGTPDLLDPNVVETLEFIVQMSKDGVGENPDRGSLFDPTFFTADIANGEVLCVIGAGWYGLDMLSNFSPREFHGIWRFMPLPRWTDEKSKSRRRTSSFSGQGLLIYKRSKQVDRSWQFIEWVMTDIDANVERYLQGNAFPSFMPSWGDTRLARKDSIFKVQSLGATLAELSVEVPPHIQSPHRAALVNLLREKYWQQLMDGTLAPKEALEKIQAELLKK